MYIMTGEERQPFEFSEEPIPGGNSAQEEVTVSNMRISADELLNQQNRRAILPEKATTRKEHYVYIDSGRVPDVLNESVNFMGIVVDWEEPRKTKGPDLMMSLKVADFSTHLLGGPLEVRVFARDMQGLPKPKKPGDIIRIHRARVDCYTNPYSEDGATSYQLVVSMSRREVGCSFMLLDAEAPSDPKKEYEPYKVSHTHFHLDQRIVRLLDVLRKFSADGTWKAFAKAAQRKADESTKYRRQIRSVYSRNEGTQFFDLVALVVHVDPKGIDGNPIVWVWDGTNARPYPPYLDFRNSLKPKTEIELTQVEKSMYNLYSTMNRIQLDYSQVEWTPPSFGTIMPIMFWYQPKDIEYPSQGKWIRIRNCGFAPVDSQVQGYFVPSTRWAPWTGGEKKLLQAALEDPRGPADGCQEIQYGPLYSETLHNIRPVTPIRDILWSASRFNSNVRMTTAEYFRCKARIMAIWPGNDEIRNITIQKSTLDPELIEEDVDPDDEWVFACRLTLEDPTGYLEADVFGQDGAYFFSNITSPKNLSLEENKDDLLKLRKYLCEIMGVYDTGSHPLGRWFDICIKMYQPVGAPEPHFRVFDTIAKYVV